MPNAVTNALRVSPVLTHAPTRPDPSFTTPRRTTSGDKTRSSLQVKILFPWFEELVRRLRETEEWGYVEREVDIRLSR